MVNYLYILIGLFAADILTTLYILKHGGRELNPVMAKIISVFGNDLGLILAKGVALGALVYFAPTVIPYAVYGYIPVVLWNLYQIVK